MTVTEKSFDILLVVCNLMSSDHVCNDVNWYVNWYLN